MIVAVPAVTPVTLPVIEFTVATAAFDVVHTPPDVVLVKIVAEPIHAFVVPPIAASVGNALTLTTTTSVEEQLFVVPVTVYVVVAVGETLNVLLVLTTVEPLLQE